MIIDILLATLWGLPCWLWLLLAGIIPFILGWLFGSRFDRNTSSEKKTKTSYAAGAMGADQRAMQNKLNDFEKNEVELKYKIEQLEADLKKCHDKRQRLEMQNLEYKAKLEEMGALGLATGKAAGGLNYAQIFDLDNLQVVEGIGPKVEKTLKKNKINTLSDLAGAKVEDLSAILAANKMQMMKPESWPRQAELAKNNQWAELIEYQKFLDGGREKTGDFENPSKVEKMAMKILGFSKNPEDLKIIEGIGPKIEGILKEAGIKTWSDLAGTPIARIKEVLANAGDRYKLAKPNTWPKQAKLAADGHWGELKEYQDYLDKGVDPKA
ncbi:MAG TPA: helix-hairpin-helix domain-containing protein [Saprospiraceae bacterium]|nr:helix-hairpin-helix domain-containing protein [Saprospiraceae bacterium]